MNSESMHQGRLTAACSALTASASSSAALWIVDIACVMNLRDRRWFVPGLALIVSLALLGRWAMRAEDAAIAPAQPEALASIDSPAPSSSTATTQPPAIAAAAAETRNYASAFGPFRGRVLDAVTRDPVREFTLHFQGTDLVDEAPTEASPSASLAIPCSMLTFRLRRFPVACSKTKRRSSTFPP